MASREATALGCMVTVLLIPISIVASGAVLVKMWEWFIVPVFNLPSLTIGYALGISAVISYMTYQPNDCKENERGFGETIVRSCINAFLRPLITLAFGWIILKCQGR